MASYALPPYPVPTNLIAQYGRGRQYFPAPVEFRVPVLCCVAPVRLFYFVVSVSTDWENWELAVPQAADNYVLCYTNPANLTKGPAVPTTMSYVGWTVAQMRRRLPQFWQQSVVLTADGTWLPMPMADPFNLLGFTCLPTQRACPWTDLPVWADVGQKSSVLAMSVVKPVYVPTPLSLDLLQAYETERPRSRETPQEPRLGVVQSTADIAAALQQPVARTLTLADVQRHPTVEHVRDYFFQAQQQRQGYILHVKKIVDVYYHDEQSVVYLCIFHELQENTVWVSESLLEFLELYEPEAYEEYRLVLRVFHERLKRHLDDCKSLLEL